MINILIKNLLVITVRVTIVKSVKLLILCRLMLINYLIYVKELIRRAGDLISILIVKV